MTASPLALRPRPDGAAVAVRSFESATAEAIATSHVRSERTTIWVLTAFVFAFVVFISVFKLDRIVKATGRIVPIAGTITVQPFDKSIIKTTLVSVGQVVKKGDVLATLDPTFAAADLAQLRQQVASLEAETRRQEAEESGQVFVPKDNSPYETLQGNLFNQRKTDYDANVASFDEKIRGTETAIDGLHHAIDSGKAHSQIASQIEDMQKSLEAKGYASTLSRLTATGQRIDLNAQMVANEDNLKTMTHTLESLKADRDSFINKWHTDNLNDLVIQKNALDSARRDLAKSEKASELTKLVAPEDAIVVSVPKLTGGAVAVEAQPLFSLVPAGTGLEANVQVDAQDVGFVHEGQKVTIKLDAFKFLEHGTLSGVVKALTQESFTDDQTQDAVTSSASGSSSQPRTPYYGAHIMITAVNLHDVPPDFHLLPGMTITADVVAGRRTILWYLLGSALRSGSEAMREP
ncbi:MAG TPA: HlyD family type I secretion periplasmic adaptor subunit [Alphaproteobacteria bacterium]|nr:HlyD family type I secretion periplasmic adaptor subunit [Alphaproteobacteria bacterium]